MHAERFRTLLTAEGPFASVYFDDSHDTEDAEAQLELKWRGIREDLHAQGADPLVAAIEPAVLASRPAVGRSGRGVVANADGVILNEHLIRPPTATLTRVSELPYIVPLVEHAAENHAYLLVAVDHAGGDITVHRAENSQSETVDGEGYPVHHAHSAETSGYGDPQRAAENARSKNIRAVSERLTSLFDVAKPDFVFVIGEVRSRADFVGDLPERVAERVVELHVGPVTAASMTTRCVMRSTPSSSCAGLRPSTMRRNAFRLSRDGSRGWLRKALMRCVPPCATARSKR